MRELRKKREENVKGRLLKVKRGQGMSRDGEGRGLEIISLTVFRIPEPHQGSVGYMGPGGEGREVGVR